MARQFDARHLSSTRNTQVQMSNWYEIVVPDISDLTIMVKNCTLPEISAPAVELGFGNTRAKVPGQIEYGDGNFAFYDAIKKDIQGQLDAWFNKIYDFKTGKMGWVDEFKKDVTVTLYGPDGTAERVWYLEGCWPTSITHGDLTGESSDAIEVQVTMAYDRAYREDLFGDNKK